MPSRRKDDHGEWGQSTVELALVLPVLTLLLLAVLQVGLVARDVVIVTHAAREAARAAAVDPSAGVARQAALRASGLPPDRLAVRVRGGTDAGDRVTVVLTYHSPGAVPLVGRWVAGRAITATATMRVEARPGDHPRHEAGQAAQITCSRHKFMVKCPVM